MSIRIVVVGILALFILQALIALFGPTFMAAMPARLTFDRPQVTTFHPVAAPVANHTHYVNAMIDSPSFREELRTGVLKSLSTRGIRGEISVRALVSGLEGVGHLRISTSRVRPTRYSIATADYEPVTDARLETEGAALTDEIQELALERVMTELEALNGKLDALDALRTEVGELSQTLEDRLGASVKASGIGSRQVKDPADLESELSRLRTALIALISHAETGGFDGRALHRLSLAESPAVDWIQEVRVTIDVTSLDDLSGQIARIPTRERFEDVKSRQDAFANRLEKRHGVQVRFGAGFGGGGLFDPEWLVGLEELLESTGILEKAITTLSIGDRYNSVSGSQEAVERYSLTVAFPTPMAELESILRKEVESLRPPSPLVRAEREVRMVRAASKSELGVRLSASSPTDESRVPILKDLYTALAAVSETDRGALNAVSVSGETATLRNPWFTESVQDWQQPSQLAAGCRRLKTTEDAGARLETRVEKLCEELSRRCGLDIYIRQGTLLAEADAALRTLEEALESDEMPARMRRLVEVGFERIAVKTAYGDTRPRSGIRRDLLLPTGVTREAILTGLDDVEPFGIDPVESNKRFARQMLQMEIDAAQKSEARSR